MIDFDNIEIDMHCPKCNFINEALIIQVRLQDLIICRGCKSNIQLIDSNNSVRKSKKEIEKQFADIEKLLNFKL